MCCLEIPNPSHAETPRRGAHPCPRSRVPSPRSPLRYLRDLLCKKPSPGNTSQSLRLCVRPCRPFACDEHRRKGYGKLTRQSFISPKHPSRAIHSVGPPLREHRRTWPFSYASPRAHQHPFPAMPRHRRRCVCALHSPSPRRRRPMPRHHAPGQSLQTPDQLRQRLLLPARPGREALRRDNERRFALPQPPSSRRRILQTAQAPEPNPIIAPTPEATVSHDDALLRR